MACHIFGCSAQLVVEHANGECDHFCALCYPSIVTAASPLVIWATAQVGAPEILVLHQIVLFAKVQCLSKNAKLMTTDLMRPRLPHSGVPRRWLAGPTYG